jgi:hypothetical protein
MQTLDRICPGSRLFQLPAVLIEAIYQNYRSQLQRPAVFLNLRETRFEVIILDQAVIHYANSFSYRAPEDVVYYILFIFDQMGLNTEQTRLHLMGKVGKESPVYHHLFRYVRKVDFVRRTTAYSYSPVFNDIPHHGYFPLLNLNQCG